MESLESLFRRYVSPEDMAEAPPFDAPTPPRNKNLHALPPDPTTGADLNIMDKGDFLESLIAASQNAKPRFPPLERLPCANVKADKYKTCPNPGTLACSACKLVSYCSEVCVCA